jgi:TRAP-type mannitol/chloroaromatic compound transport system permease small subunit
MAFADALQKLASWLGAPVRWIGLSLGVFVVVTVIGMFGVVLLRYALGFSQPWLRELVLAANAAVFLLGAAYALARDEHVRVDVFSKRFSPRAKRSVELAGLLLIVLPFAIFVWLISDQYVATSFAIGERSNEPGGLPYLWVQKALILAFAALLVLQALSNACALLARWLKGEAA